MYSFASEPFCMRFIASFIAISTLMGCSKKEKINSSTEPTTTLAPAGGTTTVAPAEATGTIAATEETTTVAPATKETTTVAPATEETTTVAPAEETTTVAAAEEPTTVFPVVVTTTAAAVELTTTVAAAEETTTVAPATEETTTVSAVAMPPLSGGESGYVARWLHTTTTTPTTMPEDAILAAIDRIHSRSVFDPLGGDQELSLCIANSVLAFPESVPALERWDLAHGPALLRLAQDNLESRALLIKPLLILVGHIWQIPRFDPEIFLAESRLRDFFTPGNIATIQRFIVDNHRARANYPDNAHRMLIQAYVAPLVAVMPSLMSSHELRQIVLEHRMLSHRFGVASRRNNPTFEISRATAFEDSINTLLRDDITQCTRVSCAVWRNENQAGSRVVREWFTEVSLQINSPTYGLFRPRISEQPNYMEVSPLGVDRPNHVQLYRAVGRFMGLALIQRNPIGLTFPTFFYARILGTEVTLDEVAEDEPALFNSLNNIMSFATDAELAGYHITIDGVSSACTVANREDLIRRKVNSLIDPAVDPSLNLIIAAFREMIPVTVTEGFTARALRDLIVGSSTLEVEDLMANAQLFGYRRQSPQIIWLESFLSEMGQEDRRRFLRFCTGITQLPIGGFAALDDEQFIITRHESRHSLPTSAICYNQFNLPQYESDEQLRRMVGLALNAPSGIGYAY